MLPVVAGLLPLYLFAQAVNVLDNIWYLLILYTSMNLPIVVWMLRSFLAEVPVEMLEAAQLDGAGLVRTLRSIIAPVVLPGIAAAALICFIFSWNELLFARVLTGTAAQTAPVFLTGFVTSQGLFLAKVCAASLVVSLPVLIAGFAAQDKLAGPLARRRPVGQSRQESSLSRSRRRGLVCPCSASAPWTRSPTRWPARHTTGPRSPRGSSTSGSAASTVPTRRCTSTR